MSSELYGKLWQLLLSSVRQEIMNEEGNDELLNDD